MKRIYLSLFLLLAASTVYAQQMIVLDSLIQEAGNFSIAGSNNSDFGLEATSGDFNGDGIQDVVYTSSENVGEGGSDTRGVTIIFGSDSLTAQNLNRVSFGFNPANPPSSFEFGTEAGSGDLNNDGIDDLIIGIPEWDDEKGLLYVVYGRQEWLSPSYQLGALTDDEAFKVYGRISKEPGNLGKAGSRLGDAYAIGDIDDDGLNDLYVSAPRSNTSFDQSFGAGYVIYGKAIQGSSTVDLDTLSQKSGMVIFPSNPNEGVGNEAMFADLNGDGIEDLLMAAENAWSQGRIHMIYGSTNLPDSLDLNINSTNDLRTTIFGSISPSQTRFGKDFDTGDFNGDGVMDLVVSASRTGGIAGTVYIIYGGVDTFESNVVPTSFVQGEGVLVNGLIGDYLGIYLDVADFNNDGFDDIVFSGGIHDLDPGITQFYKNRLRILFGTDESLPLTLDLDNPDPAFNITEITAISDSRDIGNDVTAIDLNNDSNTDLIFGSYSRNQATADDQFSLNIILNIDFNFDQEQDTTAQDSSFFAGGSGTEMDPYQISTFEQLDSVRFFPDSYFTQTADIDLGELTGTGWIPIGYDQNDTYLRGERVSFSGVYDGGGYTISNLNIHNRGKIIGLFYSLTGTVKNVIIDGADFEYIPFDELPDSILFDPDILIEDAPRFSGIVAGRVEAGGVIENVEVREGSIEYGSLGLITGWNEGSITDSYAQGTVFDAFQGGGLVSVNLGTISRTTFEGSLQEIPTISGGLVGSNLEGNIYESNAIVEVEGSSIFGGLVGVYNYGNVENNYVEFQINDSTSTGGIIGSYGISATLNPNQDPLSVKYNYAFGEIPFRDEDIGTYRGIIGFAFQTPSDSAVTVTKVKDNYWNTELFGEEDDVVGFRIAAGGITTSEMKTESTFQNWDFTSIWNIDEGSSFPYLRNNPPSEKPGIDITSTNNSVETEIASQVQLSQNYPNPFNPTTNISYQLPTSGKVNLEVFDMLGRKVRILVQNEIQSSGEYSVLFNAGNLPSGVYIYKLTLDNKFSVIKRLTLIK